MDLKGFVRETIVQIVQGIQEAQEGIGNTGASVIRRLYGPGTHDAITATDGSTIQYVSFDVAVTTTQEKSAKGGGGLFVAGIGLGGHAQRGSGSSAVSRIQFSIPLRLPDVGESPPAEMTQTETA